jgi:hypothetical protein
MPPDRRLGQHHPVRRGPGDPEGPRQRGTGHGRRDQREDEERRRQGQQDQQRLNGGREPEAGLAAPSARRGAAQRPAAPLQGHDESHLTADKHRRAEHRRAREQLRCRRPEQETGQQSEGVPPDVEGGGPYGGRLRDAWQQAHPVQRTREQEPDG